MTKLLLDTHIAVWLIDAPDRLKPVERQAIAAEGAQICISAISVWEVRIKWLASQRSNRIWNVRPEELLKLAENNGFVLEPLTAEISAARPMPATTHGDPFDDMLLVHADRVGARLLTRDTKLLGHPLAYQA